MPGSFGLKGAVAGERRKRDEGQSGPAVTRCRSGPAPGSERAFKTFLKINVKQWADKCWYVSIPGEHISVLTHERGMVTYQRLRIDSAPLKPWSHRGKFREGISPIGRTRPGLPGLSAISRFMPHGRAMFPHTAPFAPLGRSLAVFGDITQGLSEVAGLSLSGTFPW